MLEKGAVAVAVATALLGLYLFVGYTVEAGTVVRSLALPVDWMIPFVPATSWYYLPFFPLALLVALVSLDNRRHLYGAVAAMTIAGVVNFSFFVFMPVAYPRPPLEGFGVLAGPVPYAMLEIPGDTWSRTFMGFIHWFDPPSCTFPSGHVTYPVCIALVLRHTRPRVARALLVGAALFWVSTWTTKQHFVVDGIAGAFTGWLGYWLVWRRRA
jgi:membrane-associated phospholipid phosphatase